MDTSPRWKVIWFVKGKRQEPKLIRDPRSVRPLVTRMNETEGVRAHIVCRRFPNFPPKGEADDDDQMWCPYCRRWRWFAVPKRRGAFTELGIKCCKWCLISEDDYYVKRFNGTWSNKPKRRRKKKGRRRK